MDAIKIWFLILFVVVGTILYSTSRSKYSINKSKNDSTNKTYTSDFVAVNKDYADEAIKFFDGYLSLCKKHSVMAVCSLLSIGKDEFGIKTEMNCTITAIDGEHADDAFEVIKRVWMQLRQEKMNTGDYAAVTYAGDSYIKEYFGCEDLHYAFTEADEYQFENGQVVMSFERELFTRNGGQWQPTLSFIKQELQKKWENATIDVGKGGIIVKPLGGKQLFSNKEDKIMLTEEQKVTLQVACILYEQAQKEKRENKGQFLKLLNDAFGKLLEHIDDVDDIYYRVVFADCIDEMQQEGDIEFNDVILDSKTAFYVQAVMWFLDEHTQEFNTYFTAYLFKAFDALGRMYLRGEHGVKKSDSAAYTCYSCITRLGDPAMSQFVETAYLSEFVKDNTTGEIIFTGVR